MIPGFGRTGFGRDELYPDIIYIYTYIYIYIYIYNPIEITSYNHQHVPTIQKIILEMKNLGTKNPWHPMIR
jgi:hypothetical protein